MLKSLPGHFIEMWTKEICFGTEFLRFFQSIFDFESWFEETPALRNSEMELEHLAIGPPSKVEPIVSSGVPEIKVLCT